MNPSPSSNSLAPPGGATFVRAKDELRSALAPARADGRTIGLVPTMGSLHDGHLSLLRAAREECDVVVMSLFVNPTQFGPGEDLERYPRDEERDARLASEAGRRPRLRPLRSRRSTPTASRPRSRSAGLTEVLDGDPARRGPEHFRGVTTVVAKLFNTVGPDVAYFGQKDAQQLAVIRRMVRDLDIPVRVEGLPTVREAGRAGDELAQRLPRRRRPRARGRALEGPCRGRGGPARSRSPPASRRRAASSRRRGSSPSTSRRATQTTSPRSPS